MPVLAATQTALPEPASNQHLVRGWQAYQDGNIAEALEAYAQALKAAPNDASLWYDTGCLYALHQEPDKAKAALERAIVLSPRFADAHDALGQVLEREGAFTKALESYASAAALSPGRVPFLRHLIRIHVRLKQLGAAREALQRLLTIAPTDAESRYLLGVIELKDEQPDLAVNDFKRALESAPNDVATLNGLALASMRIREFDQAARALEQAQAIDPKDAKTHNNLGLLAAARENWEQARAAWRRALELQPGLKAAGHNLAALEAAAPTPSEPPNAPQAP